MADTGWRKIYLPEIHDLYPGMKPGAPALADLFPQAARDRIAWSIVPNWQGRSVLTDHPDSAAEIGALPGTPVLHGWTHSLGPDVLNWVFYGHDNRSEFRSLSRAEAADRLDKATGTMERALGAAPEWFCAPRWQQAAPVEAELRARGFRGHLAMAGLKVYEGGMIPMPAVNFDEGERAWKRALAAPPRRALIRRILRAGRPFRFVLHPDDALRPSIRQEIRALSDRLDRAGWWPVTLEEAVALWKEQA